MTCLPPPSCPIASPTATRYQHIPPSIPTPMQRVDAIVNYVCTRQGIKPALLHKKWRKRELVIARQICSYLLHTWRIQTYEQIAAYFGQDHTTVMNSVKKVRWYIEVGDAATEWIPAVLEDGFNSI